MWWGQGYEPSTPESSQRAERSPKLWYLIFSWFSLREQPKALVSSAVTLLCLPKCLAIGRQPSTDQAPYCHLPLVTCSEGANCLRMLLLLIHPPFLHCLEVFTFSRQALGVTLVSLPWFHLTFPSKLPLWLGILSVSEGDELLLELLASWPHHSIHFTLLSGLLLLRSLSESSPQFTSHTCWISTSTNKRSAQTLPLQGLFFIFSFVHNTGLWDPELGYTSSSLFNFSTFPCWTEECWRCW